MLYAIIAAVFLLFLTVSVIGGIYMYRFAIVRDKKTPDWWTHPEKLEPPQHMTPENAAIVTHGRQWILAHASKPYYRVSRDGVSLEHARKAAPEVPGKRSVHEKFAQRPPDLRDGGEDGVGDVGIGRGPPPRQQEKRREQQPQQNTLAGFHLSASAPKKCASTRSLQAAKAAPLRLACASAGTGRISAIRPGRALMTTMRSPR